MHSCIENDAEEIWSLSATAFCFILFYCIWKPWSMNLVFMFGRNSSALEVLRLFSLHLSLSQNVGDRESRGVASSLWAFTSIFHMHYETQLIKLQVFAMTRPPSICNKYLFIPSIFSYSVCVSCLLVGAADWVNQILCLF